MCLHYSIKAWFVAPLATSAPYQDLNFLKDLIRYQSIDKCISEITIKKMCGHLWYLSPEAAALLFFDPDVPVDTIRKMILALKIDIEEDNINRYVLNPKDSIGILYNDLEDLFCARSMQFFKRFKINTNFLTLDSSKWSE